MGRLSNGVKRNRRWWEGDRRGQKRGGEGDGGEGTYKNPTYFAV